MEDPIIEFSLLLQLIVGLHTAWILRLVFNPQNYYSKVFYLFSHRLSLSRLSLQHPSLAAASSGSLSPHGPARVPRTARHRARARVPCVPITQRVLAMRHTAPVLRARVPCTRARALLTQPAPGVGSPVNDMHSAGTPRGAPPAAPLSASTHAAAPPPTAFPAQVRIAQPRPRPPGPLCRPRRPRGCIAPPVLPCAPPVPWCITPSAPPACNLRHHSSSLIVTSPLPSLAPRR